MRFRCPSWNLRHPVRRYVTVSHAVTQILKGIIGKFTVTDECSYFRGLSIASAPQTDKFRQQVRECDGVCVITKVKKSLRSSTWETFHAAHIFPAAYENLLNEDDALRNCITLNNSPRESGIHSVQNRILLAKMSTPSSISARYLSTPRCASWLRPFPPKHKLQTDNKL